MVMLYIYLQVNPIHLPHMHAELDTFVVAIVGLCTCNWHLCVFLIISLGYNKEVL